MRNKELCPHPPHTKVDSYGYDRNGYRGGWIPLPKPEPINHFYEYKRKLLQIVTRIK